MFWDRVLLYVLYWPWTQFSCLDFLNIRITSVSSSLASSCVHSLLFSTLICFAHFSLIFLFLENLRGEILFLKDKKRAGGMAKSLRALGSIPSTYMFVTLVPGLLALAPSHRHTCKKNTNENKIKVNIFLKKIKVWVGDKSLYSVHLACLRPEYDPQQVKEKAMSRKKKKKRKSK